MPHIPNSFTKDDYILSKRDELYKGVFCMARYHLSFRLYNGGWSNTVTREILERPKAAAILPYDPILDRVVLIEQFRPGALNSTESPWLLEVVAGIFEADEEPKKVAIREAKEEADCEILDIYPISEYFVSPGGSNEFVYLYCGRIDASKSGGFFGLLEENEDIRAFVLSADEAFNLLKEDKIKTVPAIISLQWLQLNRERLRKLWQKK